MWVTMVTKYVFFPTEEEACVYLSLESDFFFIESRDYGTVSCQT